jgi:predicted permease
MTPRWLFRVLAAAYPPALRRAYPGDLAASLEHAWHVNTGGRPWAGSPLAFIRLVADLCRSWIGSRGERRWLESQAGGEPPAGPRFVRGLARDAAGAARAFRAARGFYGGIVLTLALGIGANAAVFSLVRAVVLQPLPYDRQDELVMVWGSWIVPQEFWRHAVTPRYLLGWREHARDVVTVAGVKGVGSLEAQMDFEMPSGVERLRGAMATSNLFQVLGTDAALGRVFTEADETAGSAQIAVISHALWRRAFQSDPAIVGRSIVLTTGWGKARRPRSYTVIGVLPARFRFTYPEAVEIWTIHPWTAIAADDPDSIQFQVVGRLTPGASFEQAQSRLAALHDAIWPERANVPLQSRRTTRLERIHDWVVADTRPTMTLLSGVALLLLVITCATAANALFIRISERRRELALRTALGASRGRLARQLLTEGALLSTAGTVAGLGLALAAMPVLRTLVPPTVPRGDEIGVDSTVVLFAAGAVIVVTVLSALVPAWRGARVGISEALKRSAGTASADRVTSRWRRGLVALQATIAAALLVLSSLLLLSFWRLVNVPLGFDPGDLLAVEMRVIGTDLFAPERLRVIQDEILTRVRAVPGVQAVAATTAVPFRGVDWRVNVAVDDNGRTVGANRRHVDPEYFALLRMAPVRGRLLADHDRAGAPLVAVVSESFAREAFGGADPIGTTIGETTKTTIVGVVEDVRYATLQPVPALAKAIYVPRAQRPSELICLLVQPQASARDLPAAIRQAVREADPTLPAMGITPVASIIDGTLADRRFYTAAVGTFASLALTLTIAGLVVVVIRALVERQKEMAIRAALGATTRSLRLRVIREGLQPVAIGAGSGLVVAWAGAVWLAPFLFEVPPRSGMLYLLVGVLLLAIAAVAGWAAGRRAARLSPSAVLRE